MDIGLGGGWTMPLYHLHVSNDGQTHSILTVDCPGRNAAWAELIDICSDLIRDVTKSLQRDGEWRIELLDQTEKPVGRIRIIAECFD